MSCCAAVSCSAEIAKESLRQNDRVEEERIIAASVELSDGTYKTDFIVPKMHCIACISAIERGLLDTAPVLQVRANLSLSTVSVTWDRNRGNVTQVPKRLIELGFENHLGDFSESTSNANEKSKSLLVALAVSGFAAANVMLLSVSVWSGADLETARLFNLISGLIAVPAVLFAGQPFFKSAASSLRVGRLNMDVPISLAVLLALAMSMFEGLSGGKETYFDASVTLLFFLLIGRYLDTLMRQKARSAVERLATLTSKLGVMILTDGSINTLPIKDIRPGMKLRVYPGERFPVNGEIISGETEIDCAHVTGESDHKSVTASDLVQAGSLNLSSSVDIKATTDAEKSFLGEMQRMIQEAEHGRGDYLRVADQMARIYAPAVHLLALIAFVGWMIASGGDWHSSLYTAISVLIITCPCALGLAVPVAHVIAANRLMQDGVLMRDGTGLERLAQINTVVFDKTGTLTKGAPDVFAVTGKSDGLRSIIKAMAQASSHPIAKSLSAYFKNVNSSKIENIFELPGQGVQAINHGKKLRLGKQEWVSEIASSDERSLSEHSVSFAAEGEKAVHFDMQDMLREDAVAAVQELAKIGLSTEILSGDQPKKVGAIAKELAIDQFRSRQTPKQKIARINVLQTENERVLMVGDGINDAPALAAGHVSFVPASASDIGRHSADFVFTRKSLLAIPNSISLAFFTAKIVKQNFGLAIAYNCIAIPLAMAGMITPLIAAIAMSASSIIVVANSFRISFGQNRGLADNKSPVPAAFDQKELAIS